MKVLLQTLSEKQKITRVTAKDIIAGLCDPEAKPEQIGAILALLGQRNLSSVELTVFAEYLLSLNPQKTIPQAMDVCGTGGDGLFTVNVSTAVAFVVAASGVPVVKHGNRSVSSRSGSIDVLEALGVKIAVSKDDVIPQVGAHGLSFVFAPAFHSALVRLGPIRRSLGFRTFFNVLGPLINPFRPGRRVVGVYSREFLRPVAEVLRNLGCQEAMVLCAEDGMDEVSLNSPTHVVHLKDQELHELILTPESFGLSWQALEGTRGGDPAQNASLLRSVLMGASEFGKDLILANAAVALFVSGIAIDLKHGVRIARQTLESGKAGKLLDQMIPSPENSGGLL
ncbi:MAG: anthranilate phosphoribosyltransferase [Bdellovibrionales bacterium]|nr:anthranilate phosphoribosyltransferase [Bdellovibrionales bacterium]